MPLNVIPAVILWLFLVAQKIGAQTDGTGLNELSYFDNFNYDSATNLLTGSIHRQNRDLIDTCTIKAKYFPIDDTNYQENSLTSILAGQQFVFDLNDFSLTINSGSGSAARKKRSSAAGDANTNYFHVDFTATCSPDPNNFEDDAANNAAFTYTNPNLFTKPTEVTLWPWYDHNENNTLPYLYISFWPTIIDNQGLFDIYIYNQGGHLVDQANNQIIPTDNDKINRLILDLNTGSLFYELDYANKEFEILNIGPRELENNSPGTWAGATDFYIAIAPAGGIINENTSPAVIGDNIKSHCDPAIMTNNICQMSDAFKLTETEMSIELIDLSSESLSIKYSGNTPTGHLTWFEIKGEFSDGHVHHVREVSGDPNANFWTFPLKTNKKYDIKFYRKYDHVNSYMVYWRTYFSYQERPMSDQDVRPYQITFKYNDEIPRSYQIITSEDYISGYYPNEKHLIEEHLATSNGQIVTFNKNVQENTTYTAISPRTNVRGDFRIFEISQNLPSDFSYTFRKFETMTEDEYKLNEAELSFMVGKNMFVKHVPDFLNSDYINHDLFYLRSKQFQHYYYGTEFNFNYAHTHTEGTVYLIYRDHTFTENDGYSNSAEMNNVCYCDASIASQTGVWSGWDINTLIEDGWDIELEDLIIEFYHGGNSQGEHSFKILSKRLDGYSGLFSLPPTTKPFYGTFIFDIENHIEWDFNYSFEITTPNIFEVEEITYNDVTIKYFGGVSDSVYKWEVIAAPSDKIGVEETHRVHIHNENQRNVSDLYGSLAEYQEYLVVARRTELANTTNILDYRLFFTTLIKLPDNFEVSQTYYDLEICSFQNHENDFIGSIGITENGDYCEYWLTYTPELDFWQEYAINYMGSASTYNNTYCRNLPNDRNESTWWEYHETPWCYTNIDANPRVWDNCKIDPCIDLDNDNTGIFKEPNGINGRKAQFQFTWPAVDNPTVGYYLLVATENSVIYAFEKVRDNFFYDPEISDLNEYYFVDKDLYPSGFSIDYYGAENLTFYLSQKPEIMNYQYNLTELNQFCNPDQNNNDLWDPLGFTYDPIKETYCRVSVHKFQTRPMIFNVINFNMTNLEISVQGNAGLYVRFEWEDGSIVSFQDPTIFDMVHIFEANFDVSGYNKINVVFYTDASHSVDSKVYQYEVILPKPKTIEIQEIGETFVTFQTFYAATNLKTRIHQVDTMKVLSDPTKIANVDGTDGTVFNVTGLTAGLAYAIELFDRSGPNAGQHQGYSYDDPELVHKIFFTTNERFDFEYNSDSIFVSFYGNSEQQLQIFDHNSSMIVIDEPFEVPPAAAANSNFGNQHNTLIPETNYTLSRIVTRSSITVHQIMDDDSFLFKSRALEEGSRVWWDGDSPADGMLNVQLANVSDGLLGGRLIRHKNNKYGLKIGSQIKIYYEPVPDGQTAKLYLFYRSGEFNCTGTNQQTECFAACECTNPPTSFNGGFNESLIYDMDYYWTLSDEYLDLNYGGVNNGIRNTEIWELELDNSGVVILPPTTAFFQGSFIFVNDIIDTEGLVMEEINFTTDPMIDIKQITSNSIQILYSGNEAFKGEDYTVHLKPLTDSLAPDYNDYADVAHGNTGTNKKNSIWFMRYNTAESPNGPSSNNNGNANNGGYTTDFYENGWELVRPKDDFLYYVKDFSSETLYELSVIYNINATHQETKFNYTFYTPEMFEFTRIGKFSAELIYHGQVSDDTSPWGKGIWEIEIWEEEDASNKVYTKREVMRNTPILLTNLKSSTKYKIKVNQNLGGHNFWIYSEYFYTEEDLPTHFNFKIRYYDTENCKMSFPDNNQIVYFGHQNFSAAVDCLNTYKVRDDEEEDFDWESVYPTKGCLNNFCVGIGDPPASLDADKVIFNDNVCRNDKCWIGDLTNPSSADCAIPECDIEEHFNQRMAKYPVILLDWEMSKNSQDTMFEERYYLVIIAIDPLGGQHLFSMIPNLHSPFVLDLSQILDDGVDFGRFEPIESFIYGSIFQDLASSPSFAASTLQGIPKLAFYISHEEEILRQNVSSLATFCSANQTVSETDTACLVSSEIDLTPLEIEVFDVGLTSFTIEYVTGPINIYNLTIVFPAAFATNQPDSIRLEEHGQLINVTDLVAAGVEEDRTYYLRFEYQHPFTNDIEEVYYQEVVLLKPKPFTILDITNTSVSMQYFGENAQSGFIKIFAEAAAGNVPINSRQINGGLKAPLNDRDIWEYPSDSDAASQDLIPGAVYTVQSWLSGQIIERGYFRTDEYTDFQPYPDGFEYINQGQPKVAGVLTKDYQPLAFSSYFFENNLIQTHRARGLTPKTNYTFWEMWLPWSVEIHQISDTFLPYGKGVIDEDMTMFSNPDYAPHILKNVPKEMLESRMVMLEDITFDVNPTRSGPTPGEMTFDIYYDKLINPETNLIVYAYSSSVLNSYYNSQQGSGGAVKAFQACACTDFDGDLSGGFSQILNETLGWHLLDLPANETMYLYHTNDGDNLDYGLTARPLKIWKKIIPPEEQTGHLQLPQTLGPLQGGFAFKREMENGKDSFTLRFEPFTTPDMIELEEVSTGNTNSKLEYFYLGWDILDTKPYNIFLTSEDPNAPPRSRPAPARDAATNEPVVQLEQSLSSGYFYNLTVQYDGEDVYYKEFLTRTLVPTALTEEIYEYKNYNSSTGDLNLTEEQEQFHYEPIITLNWDWIVSYPVGYFMTILDQKGALYHLDHVVPDMRMYWSFSSSSFKLPNHNFRAQKDKSIDDLNVPLDMTVPEMVTFIISNDVVYRDNLNSTWIDFTDAASIQSSVESLCATGGVNNQRLCVSSKTYHTAVVKVELATVEPEYVSIDFSLDRGNEQQETTTQASSSSSALRKRRSTAAAGGSVSNSEHTIRVWIETLESNYPYDTAMDLSLSSGSQYNFTGLTPSVNYKISIYEFIENSAQLMINYTFWSHPEKPYNWHANLYYTENYVNDVQDTNVSGPLDPIIKLHFWTKFQNPGEGYFLAMVTNLKSYGISKIRSGFEMKLLDENTPCAGFGKGVRKILEAVSLCFS